MDWFKIGIYHTYTIYYPYTVVYLENASYAISISHETNGNVNCRKNSTKGTGMRILITISRAYMCVAFSNT